MKKIILMSACFAGLYCSSCGSKTGKQETTMPMDTLTVKTVPPPDDPMDTMVQGHYRYETTDKEGTEPDSTR